MSQLIRMIGRGAFVALGLAAGFQAQAAIVTIDAGAACVGFTWNGTTLSCTVDTACVVSGPSTGTPGQDVVLTASCPTSTSITWTGTGTPCDSTTSNTCTTNKATALGNVTYIATGDQSAASAPKTVNWTSSVVQPGGCSLSASPSSGGPGATNVTLTAACTSGTLPFTLAWSGAAGTGACPTTATSLSTACPINGVAADSTWTVNFSNSAGNNNKNASFDYSSGGGGDFANCPAGSETINHAWGSAFPDDVNSQSFSTNYLSIRFTIPAGTTVSTNRNIGIVEFSGDPPTTREMSISTVACDWSSANAAKTSLGVAAVSTSTGPSFNYRTTSGSSYIRLVPGTPYFVNVRNPGGCDSPLSGTCNLKATIRD